MSSPTLILAEVKISHLNPPFFKNSLIKVDGFSGPDEFEKFMQEINIKANLMLKARDPEKFKWKYGDKITDYDLQRQT